MVTMHPTVAMAARDHTVKHPTGMAIPHRAMDMATVTNQDTASRGGMMEGYGGGGMMGGWFGGMR